MEDTIGTGKFYQKAYKRSPEFSSYKIELRNRVTQDAVTL